MGATEEILCSTDTTDLASALGTDEATARGAATASIPTSFNGFGENAGSATAPAQGAKQGQGDLLGVGQILGR